MYQPVQSWELRQHHGARRGVVAVRDVVLWCEGGQCVDLGIYNRRPRRGLSALNPASASLHAVGRAWDIGWRKGFDAERLAGRLAIAAQYVGISEVIYNRRRWTAEKGWQPYNGKDPHTTHIHVGFTIEWADSPQALDQLKKWAAHFLYQGAM